MTAPTSTSAASTSANSMAMRPPSSNSTVTVVVGRIGREGQAVGGVGKDARASLGERVVLLRPDHAGVLGDADVGPSETAPRPSACSARRRGPSPPCASGTERSAPACDRPRRACLFRARGGRSRRGISDSWSPATRRASHPETPSPALAVATPCRWRETAARRSPGRNQPRTGSRPGLAVSSAWASRISGCAQSRPRPAPAPAAPPRPRRRSQHALAMASLIAPHGGAHDEFGYTAGADAELVERLADRRAGRSWRSPRRAPSAIPSCNRMRRPSPRKWSTKSMVTLWPPMNSATDRTLADQQGGGAVSSKHLQFRRRQARDVFQRPGRGHHRPRRARPAEASSSAEVPARWLPPTSSAATASSRLSASLTMPAFCRSRKGWLVEASTTLCDRARGPGLAGHRGPLPPPW